MRAAFERLAVLHRANPWVATRLRHLLDRTNSGIYRGAHYIKGGGWNIR